MKFLVLNLASFRARFYVRLVRTKMSIRARSIFFFVIRTNIRKCQISWRMCGMPGTVYKHRCPPSSHMNIWQGRKLNKGYRHINQFQVLVKLYKYFYVSTFCFSKFYVWLSNGSYYKLWEFHSGHLVTWKLDNLITWKALWIACFFILYRY